MAKEIDIDNRPELFAATPPLEFIKYLMSLCASRQRRKRPSRLMIPEISKAYFFAPATREIFIELPLEEAEAGMVGKLADPRHTETMIEQIGLKGARSLKIPGVKEKKSDRELSADIDQIIDVSNNPD